MTSADLPEAVAQFAAACEKSIAEPCWINTGALRLDEDRRAELVDALEHLRAGRTMRICDRVLEVMRQPDGSIYPRTLADALIELSYVVPAADGSQRTRLGLTQVEVLRFLHDNDFPIMFCPTERVGGCVISMSYRVVAADLAAHEADTTPGTFRYFVEVVRNRAGDSESAVVYRGSRPRELAADVVWSLDQPSALPDRYHMPRVADDTYVEAYEFIGMRRSAFAAEYEELARSGLPPKVWAGGCVVPPWDVLEGRLGNDAGPTSPDPATGGSSP
jgi:hypothetical protein